jgi:hypothetical protein
MRSDHSKNIKNSKPAKGLPGYMTVEASMLIPLTMTCFVIVIYYSVFLFNHLVVYQSTYMAAHRGSILKNTVSDAVNEYIKQELNKLLDEQVYQYRVNFNTQVNAMSIDVTADTSLIQHEITGIFFSDRELKGKKDITVLRLDPVDYIRNSERFR